MRTLQILKALLLESVSTFLLPLICKQTQNSSKQSAIEGNTSSLMFGIQWDLAYSNLESKPCCILG